MNIIVTSPAERTLQLTFVSEGEVQAVLTETRLCAELSDIAVIEGKATGRALFFQKTGESEVNFSAHENLSLVLKWVRQCNQHLRLPL
jgi:flagellar biosynthesis protein FlhB